MFFTAPLVASVSLLATFAQASPAPRSLPVSEEVVPHVVLDDNGNVESFMNATRLGIDIYGPMPTDAKLVNGNWEAEVGSKAHAWIRAQIDIDWDSLPEEALQKVEKRQGSGPAQIDFTQWTGDNCQGNVITINNANYNVNYLTGDNLFSVGISRRTIRNNEHLDLSRRSGGNACGQFVIRVLGGPGCLTTNVYNCMRFWLE
ncbi:hypothetical protein HJFPF1_10969 [Paramyrothecium foliicola]|nr:hypothetical protein HJFPF1_10969 [Paramyrothecium foliicola]